MSFGGLTFKTSVAALGKINLQPSQTTHTLTFASVTTQPSTGGSPTFNTVGIDKILTLMQKPNTTPVRMVLPITPGNSAIPVSTPSHPAIVPITPTYSRYLQQQSLTDDRLLDKLSKPNPNFTPYETLTGVSQTRPEILLATSFEPIYSEGHKHSVTDVTKNTDQFVGGLNPYGEFIDAQIQVNHLRHEAMGKLISELKSEDDTFADSLKTKENQFSYNVQQLQAHSSYLRDVIGKLTNLKQVFDLRNENLKVNFSQICFDYFQDARHQLLSDLENKFESNLGFRSILSDLGFSSKNVQEFSSTKIFFQSLFEFNNVLKGYTNNLLGVNAIEQRDDANPTYINKHQIKDFNFDLSNTFTITYDFLSNLTTTQVLSSVTDVKNTFDTLFANVHLANDESKIALLLQFLSKEYNYSVALKNANFVTYVQDTFGYSVSTNFSNASFFDVLIGSVGDRITDTVNKLSKNSIATLGQITDGSVGVLPFETSYVSYENSSYTPGSIYLVDKLLDLGNGSLVYNNGNLDSYASTVNDQLGRLVTVSRYLNLLPQVYTFDKSFSKTLGQSDQLFENIIHDYLNLNDMSMKTSMDSDVVAIFNKAQTDKNLKALLFHYVFIRTYGVGNSSSTQILDVLTKEIVRNVGLTLGEDKRNISVILKRKVTDNVNHNASPSESLIHILKTSNEFLSTFFSQFKKIFDAFLLKRNGFTVYSHVQDVILMMVIFETLLTIVNKYVKKTFVGRFISKSQSSIGKEFFSTKTSFTPNMISVQTIKSKLKFDNDARVKLLFVLLSMMQQVRDTSRNVINELRSSASVASLNQILNIIGDRNSLQMIMNDQQIHLIESLVTDITDKINANHYVTGRAGANRSTSTEEDVQIGLGNEKDDITILDDSLVSENVRHALFSYLGQDKFTSKTSTNIRLMTVGVPHGFSNDLRQNIKVSQVNPQSFEPKQTDVIKLNVYKVDVEHQDLIFKPQSFLFELNRYVVRNDQQWRWIPLLSSKDDVFDGIPTRDFSFVEGKLQQRMTYYRDSQTSIFNSPEYDFLTKEQKNEIIENHVASYIFELYIRLLTGMKVSEYDFLMNPDNVSSDHLEPFIVNRLIDYRLTKIVAPVKNAINLQDLSGILKKITQPIAKDRLFDLKSVPKISVGSQVNIAHSLMLIHDLRRLPTQYSEDLNMSKKIFTPKTFERIFTVAVNPNDFEIDVTETLKTPSGQDMFNKLLRQGRIKGESQHSTFYPNVSITSQKYKLLERDKNVGDLMFEKYFVSLETALDTEV